MEKSEKIIKESEKILKNKDSITVDNLNLKQKRFLQQVHDGLGIGQAALTVGYKPDSGSKILKRPDAKAYLEKLREDEKKEIKEDVKDSPLLEALLAVREINPLTNHLEKLDKDLSEIVESYCTLSKQKERLSDSQQKRIDNLHKVIPTLQNYRRSLSDDPFKLFMEIRRMKTEDRKLAIAKAREKGLIKQLQKKKDPQSLFGRGGL